MPRRRSRGMAMSKITETMYRTGQSSSKGLRTGEPGCLVRKPGARCTNGPAGSRVAATAASAPGDAVPVLAGAPVEIAPTGQAVWMRGASLTMLHQPDSAHPSATLGRGDHRRRQDDRRQDGCHLRPVHGRGPVAVRAGRAGANNRPDYSTAARSIRSRPLTTTIALLQLTSGSTGSRRPYESRTATSCPTPRRSLSAQTSTSITT